MAPDFNRVDNTKYSFCQKCGYNYFNNETHECESCGYGHVEPNNVVKTFYYDSTGNVCNMNDPNATRYCKVIYDSQGNILNEDWHDIVQSTYVPNNTMPCPYCGNIIDEKAVFCVHCKKMLYNQPPEYNQNAQNYQPPQQYPPLQQQMFYDAENKPLSVGSYIAMFILSSIPIVRLICWIVWICGENKNKKNYAIAILIVEVIYILLAAIGVAVSTVLGFSLFNMLM